MQCKAGLSRMMEVNPMFRIQMKQALMSVASCNTRISGRPLFKFCGGDTGGQSQRGFKVLDAKTRFNKLSQMTMLWTVCQQWPNDSRFSFNCYCHEVMLIACNPGCKPIILWSQNGVMQGDPMAMVIYSIALTP